MKKYNKMIKNKKAQEEIIGFALIIILVSVILLVFLAFSLNKSKTEAIESYEVNSFLQATLQYTTTCQESSGVEGFYTIQNLVFGCDLKERCSDEKDTCKALNETLTDILKESWPTGEDRPNKGYELMINIGEESILDIQEGNLTNNCKGSSQSFSKSRSKKEFLINFEACS